MSTTYKNIKIINDATHAATKRHELELKNGALRDPSLVAFQYRSHCWVFRKGDFERLAPEFDKVNNLYVAVTEQKLLEFCHNHHGPAAWQPNDPTVCDYFLDHHVFIPVEQGIEQWNREAHQYRFNNDLMSFLKEDDSTPSFKLTAGQAEQDMMNSPFLQEEKKRAGK